MANESPVTTPWWEELRREVPVTGRWAYLDNAAVAPISRPAQRATIAWADQMATDGVIGWEKLGQQIERGRDLAAALCGADREEIALVRNTTEGISLVAEGYPWRDGDNVITFAGEFPSNLYAWMNLASRGIEVRQVATRLGQIDLDELNDACNERTRIISVSWVGYAAGWRNDLAALAEVAHRNGALLFVDAIQALGVFPLDVAEVPIDFLAADGHKWLLGPEGAGVMYVRRAHLDVLRPLGVGWNSVKHFNDYSNTNMILKESAGRYEGGTYNTVGFVSLAASLELLARYSVTDISRRVLELGDLACRSLEDIGATIASSRDPAHASGIISFTLDYEHPTRLKHLCRERGVVLNFRDGRLRVSPHAYNNEEDIERLIEALVAVTSA